MIISISSFLLLLIVILPLIILNSLIKGIVLLIAELAIMHSLISTIL